MRKCIWSAIVTLTIMLCGCGARTTTTVGPDGKILHAINCSGKFYSFEDCLAAAGGLCPQGYNVLNSQEVSRPVYNASADGSAAGSAAGSTAAYSSRFKSQARMDYQDKRRLYIQCK